MKKLLALLFVLLSLAACQQTSPDKLIQVAVLNTNQVTSLFRPKFFNELYEMKSKNRIPSFKNGKTTHDGTAVEYVKSLSDDRINTSLEKVNALKATGETKDIINASKDVFQYSKDIFEKEYSSIAKMIDEKKPPEEIETEISNLFEKHGAVLDGKIKKLDDLALPYAKKHNIDLKMIGN